MSCALHWQSKHPQPPHRHASVWTHCGKSGSYSVGCRIPAGNTAGKAWSALGPPHQALSLGAPLTHLVLVGQVVGIEGLRGQQPPGAGAKGQLRDPPTFHPLLSSFSIEGLLVVGPMAMSSSSPIGAPPANLSHEWPWPCLPLLPPGLGGHAPRSSPPLLGLAPTWICPPPGGSS